MDSETQQKQVTRQDTFSILDTLDVFAGERTVLHEFDTIMEAPNWTQDGKYLVYNAEGYIYTYELATGDIKAIDTGFATKCNNDHVLSPDNAQLAVSHHTSDDSKSRIFILPFAGGEPKQVTANGPSYLHGWSPDGERLAYCAERDGQYDIYTISVNGGEETQLTNLVGLDDGPEYSPDGNHIWFNSTRTGLMQVWRMNADGTEQIRMVEEDANCWFPHVSPDGKWVVYIVYGKDDVDAADHPPNKHVELRLIPADGGDPKTIAKLFGGQGTINVNSWSPDNRTIAFVSYRLK